LKEETVKDVIGHAWDKTHTVRDSLVYGGSALKVVDEAVKMARSVG